MMVSGITGTSGVWTDVTPGGIDLDSTHNSNDNCGVQDILVAATNPSVMYALTGYQGCWRSLNYGLTWTKQSTGGGPLESGKAWGSAISSDGSFMLTALGNSAEGSPEGRRCIFRSTDGGVTWGRSANTGHDPYNVEICRFDNTRCIAGTHDDDFMLESLDSGVTWGDALDVGTGGTGGYVSYLQDANHAIYVGQDSDDVYLLTKSGTWSAAAITDLTNAGHAHGSYQMFPDDARGRFYHPAGSNTGADGMWTSDNNGANWTRRYSTSGQVAAIATATNLYGMFSFPNGNPGANARWITSARSDGVTWAGPTVPSGMTNGAKRFAVATDGSKWVVVAGCWNGGIWRYVEP
jgi:hypothetical protein